ncbi:MAG: ABC transporter substrate-binding protein [Eubacterium sp.]|nr:ABC transporter substrate-binding protein [Eubacterium sp.]
MKTKSIIILLCITLIASVFTACSSKAPSEETTAPPKNISSIPKDDSSFKLCYTQSDSLNPYECETQNNQIISQLVFESLFNLDDSYKASRNIAEKYEYPNSTTLRVTIPSGLTFSDNTSLTADDITYSFRNAVKSSYWGASLSGISSCYAVSSTVVEFKLEYPNSYAHNLLIFPIMSMSSETSDYPIGSGRYYFTEENEEIVLKANEKDDFSPYFTTIHLENIPASDSIDNAVNIGSVSLTFRDLSRDSSKKIDSNYKLVNINNLVYIGINNKKGLGANSYIRKAINSAIDRDMLTKSAYAGFAKTASTVFNPNFELSTAEIFEATADTNAAKQAMLQSGLSNFTISLLVNGTNADRVTCAKLIKQQLEAAGFNVKLSIADTYESYEKRIQKEDFDLYLGEIKVTPDMSLQHFFSSKGSAHFGINTEKSISAEEYNKYINGETELGNFLISFSEELPFIPILYRQGMICFSKEMNGDMQGTSTDCFKNIENWYFKSE